MPGLNAALACRTCSSGPLCRCSLHRLGLHCSPASFATWQLGLPRPSDCREAPLALRGATAAHLHTVLAVATAAADAMAADEPEESQCEPALRNALAWLAEQCTPSTEAAWDRSAYAVFDSLVARVAKAGQSRVGGSGPVVG